jgi:hypothetical protein
MEYCGIGTAVATNVDCDKVFAGSQCEMSEAALVRLSSSLQVALLYMGNTRKPTLPFSPPYRPYPTTVEHSLPDRAKGGAPYTVSWRAFLPTKHQTPLYCFGLTASLTGLSLGQMCMITRPFVNPNCFRRLGFFYSRAGAYSRTMVGC